MLTPISRVSQVIGRVMYPAFSRMQENNEKLRDGYVLELKYISLITFPLMGIMFVLAPEIISSVYGVRWEPSVVILQVFCLLGLVESIGTTVGGVLYAKKRADVAFRYNIINSLVMVSAILLGMSHGVRGVAIAITIASVPLAYLWHNKTNSLIGLSWGRFLHAMRFSTFIAVASLIVLYFGKIGLQTLLYVRSDAVMIVILLLFAIGSYFFVVFLFKKSLFIEARQLILTLVGYRDKIS
jgi:PST family polysaccharide transporter